jgi:hypothetical protein
MVKRAHCFHPTLFARSQILSVVVVIEEPDGEWPTADAPQPKTCRSVGITQREAKSDTRSSRPSDDEDPFNAETVEQFVEIINPHVLFGFVEVKVDGGVATVAAIMKEDATAMV